MKHKKVTETNIVSLVEKEVNIESKIVISYLVIFFNKFITIFVLHVFIEIKKHFHLTVILRRF